MSTSESFTVRQNDHGETIASSLVDSSGTAVDLTGASVNFVVSPLGSGSRVVDAVATITDAATGSVSYVWQSADTATVGTYRGEWKVTFANGEVESFPNDSYITVNITPDL